VSLHLVSIKTMTQFVFSFWSIKPAMQSASMLGDYSTSASSTPSCFPHRTDLLGNPFLITSLLDLLFSLLSFLDHILAIFPATHECIFNALLIFSSSFTSIGSPLSYGPPWAHYLGGYQDRLLGGLLGLLGLRYTAPEGVEHKDYTGVVLD
jgi:hypothetical protein